MIIRQFLALTQDASAGRRAEATAALARAYLYGNLAPDAAWEAKTALLALLDDPSPLVRRALAEVCAASARTPRPLVVALACDVPEVAGPVLAHSPVLTDADLVDAAALGDEPVRAVIARRHHLSHAVCGALAEIGELDTLLALAENPTARMTAGRLLRMVERRGDEPALREALLARTDLPPEVRHAIGLAVAQALSTFVSGRGWLGPARCERIEREAGESAALDACAGAGAAATARLVRHLRATRRLNAGLILRAVLSGRCAFAEAALADLSGLDHAAVARAMREPRGMADLHARAGLPAALLPAMQAALSAWREAEEGATSLRGAGLSRRMIERAITACEDMPAPEMHAVLALLTRYETEAARDEAREAARAIIEEATAREAARREALADEAAWRAALESQRLPEIDATATVEACAPVAAAAETQLAPILAEAAPVQEIVAEGITAAEILPDAMLALAALTAAAASERADAASDPFNPVGDILDALPDQILERFHADRARAEADRAAGARPPRSRQAAEAVLDGLGADLLAQYRAGRPVAQVLPIAA